MSFSFELNRIERRIAALDPAANRNDAAAFARLLPSSDGAFAAPSDVQPPRAGVDAAIDASARRYGVDPALVRAVVERESGFDPAATSRTGARGLMQLMPATAADLGVADAYDPVQNVDGGTRYLRSLLDRFGGDARRAIAAYNAGPGAVDRYDGVPPFAETQRYVAAVLDSYARYTGRA